MLKGMGDMGKLLQQAQQMQAKMAEVQERLKSLEAEGSAAPAGRPAMPATARRWVSSGPAASTASGGR